MSPKLPPHINCGLTLPCEI